MSTSAPRTAAAGSIYLEPCREGAIRATPPCPEATREGAGRRGVLVLAMTILGSAMAFIDGTVVNVALPIIQADLDADTGALQWIVESYALLLAALLLVGGALGDKYGRKRVYLIGVGIFALASLACGLATSIDMLIAARALQGVGAALLIPGALALIGANFPPDQRGAAIGTWSSATAITTALGPVLGGWLAETFSWHWIFLLNLPLSVAILALGFSGIPESRNENDTGPLDWTGAGLSAVGLGGIVLALIEAGRLGAAHPMVLGSGLAGAMALVLFGIQQRRSVHAMVPLDLFRSRSFTAANLLTFTLYTALTGVLFFLPLKLIQVDGYGASMAAAAFLPFVVIMSLFSRSAGLVMDRVGARLPLTLGPAVTAAGFALLGLTASRADYWTGPFPGVLIIGAGMTLTVAPLTATVMAAVPDSRTGTASGINNAISRVAALIAIALFSLIAIEWSTARFEADIAMLPGLVETTPADRPRLIFGEVDIPPALESLAPRLEQSGRQAFRGGFQAVCVAAALLAALSALVSLSLFAPRSKPKDG